MGIIEVKDNCKYEVDEVKVTIILEVDTALHMRMGLHQQADDVTNKYVRGMTDLTNKCGEERRSRK